MKPIPALHWRIYRLPGSKEWWLIDHGPGSIVLYAKELRIGVPTVTRNAAGEHPRAWFECFAVLYLDMNDVASFEKGSE